MNLASRLSQLHQRIGAACSMYQRNPAEIRLLPVSKTQSVATLKEAVAQGLTCFGENYIQEALAKMEQLPAGIEWHCIGPVQSNKSRLVAEHFSWCQTVDSLKLVQRLSAQRSDGKDLNICLQLHLGDETSKSGLKAADLLALAQATVNLPRIRLRGLMTLPPPAITIEQQRYWFAQAREVFLQLQSRYPTVDTLSMGMSADLEAAIAEGSTMIRIGSALFGAREPKA